MHIMYILCSTADAIISGSCSVLFKVLTLNVAICSVCLHFSSFCRLRSVADFSNTEARAPNSAGRTPFFTRAKSDAVCVCGLSHNENTAKHTKKRQTNSDRQTL